MAGTVSGKMINIKSTLALRTPRVRAAPRPPSRLRMGPQQECGNQRAQGVPGQAEHQADDRGHHHQRQARQHPVGHGLGGRHQHHRLAAHQHLLQRAVGVVGGIELRHRQHRRQQGTDPDHARGDLPQRLRLRTDAEGKQQRGHGEKPQRQHDIDAPAGRQAQVPGNQDAHDVGGAAHRAILRVSPPKPGAWEGRCRLMPDPPG